MVNKARWKEAYKEDSDVGLIVLDEVSDGSNDAFVVDVEVALEVRHDDRVCRDNEKLVERLDGHIVHLGHILQARFRRRSRGRGESGGDG
jgi:hypothetical protein